MPAHTDRATTELFADLLYRISEEDEAADLDIDDAAERGWLVPEGQSLLVRDRDEGVDYLVTVQKVIR